MGRKSKLSLRGQKANAKLKLQGTVTVNKSKPVKPKTASSNGIPPSRAQNVSQFAQEVRDIHSTTIREEMKKDVHVLVVDTDQFHSLILDHLRLVKRVALKSEDPQIKAELENAGKKGSTKALAVKLRREFQIVLERVINKTGTLVKREPIQRGDLTIYFIQRKKQTEKETNFKTLQRIMTEVRKELVLNSKSGTYKRVTGILVGGLDIDYDEIVPQKGIGGTAKDLYIDRAPVFLQKDKQGKAKRAKRLAGRGAQLGHFRGPATVAASGLRQLVREAQSGLIGLTGMWFETHRRHNLVHKYDAEFKLNDIVYNIASKELGGRVDISIVGLEQTARNLYTGAMAGRELGALRNWLIKNAQAILTMKGSKPIINSIMDDILNAFTKKPKTRKYNKKIRKKGTVSQKVKGVTVNLNTVAKPDRLQQLLTKNQLQPENLNSLLALINRRLHDQIQKNMGKGGSKKILNYRTGRFARSAEVKTLYDIKEKNALGAAVKYMKNPYQVFEPGQSHLAIPGRDPHRIIGRSIRQILQEEKLANLRRVQVELHG